MSEKARLQAELASRVLSRRRLLPFIQRMNPKYLAGWVHEDICRRLERFSDDVEAGKSPRLMLLMPPRHGKACAVGTLVPTPQGFVPIEALKPGDFVFGRDGKPTKVVAVSEIWRDRELYEVVADDGASVVVDAEHEWVVRLCRKRPVFKTKTTKQLAERESPRNPALMTYSAVEYAEAVLPIDPYVLGVWLGDGCSQHATITQGAQDYDFIRIEVEQCGHLTTDRNTEGTFGVMDMQTELADLGLISNKHIPEKYRCASPAQRLALLQGLIDTDGHVASDGQVEFCSTNEELARHTLQLVRSLGVKASMLQGDATLNGVFISRKYRVMFYMADAARLPRKAALCRNGVRSPHRFLTFKPAGRGDTVCIQVAAEDHQYLVGHGYLLTHNSEIASKTFPAWHLGRHPDHEIIACSYNLSLAMQFSRRVKLLLQDESYQTVFPDTILDPNNQSTEEWGLAGKRGAYVAAGIGGGITGKGAHCLPGTTLIDTEHGRLDIAHLYRLKSVPDILTPLGPRRALAITRRSEETTYTLRFTSGAVLEATGKHPVYLPDLAAYVTAEELYGQTESNGRLNLRVVRLAVPATEVRSRKVGEAGEHGVLLREGVQSGAPCSEACPPMPDMQQTSAGDASEPQRNVLFSGVPARADTFSAEDLPAMRRGISAETFVAGLLRTRLREYGAQVQDDWAQEFELQGRQFIRILVRPDAGAGDGAGQELRGVRHAGEVALPPHRRGSDTQRAGKSDTPVRGAPSRAPQVCYDTLSMVERRGGEPVEVYDLQVEEAGCFFADGILVGNCLIIDDPIKNAEEADSANTRESIWDWYGSTAYTRLAPGGGVLVIQTWWHDDDLAGRIQQAMAEDEEADQFEIIKYPAIAEEAEFLDTETDLIVRVPVDTKGEVETLQAAADAGYDITPLKYLRSKGDALHADRYDTYKLQRIKKTLAQRFWSALFQQNPVPDDGMYFTKEQFRRRSVPGVKEANVYIAFDFAISEKQTNDYTVGSVGLQDFDDVLHIAEVIRFKSKDAFFIVDSILNLAQRWYHPSLTIGLEDGQIYRSIEALLRKRMRERKFYPSIEVLRPITDKQARARALQGRMQQGMVSFNDQAEWYDVVRNEMLRFPAGVHDDCVDSLAWLAQLVVGKEAPRPPRAKQLPSWKDKLKAGGSGSTSHMAA